MHLLEQYKLNASAQNGAIGALATNWFDSGNNVSVTNTPNPHYHFTRWLGDVPSESVSNNPVNLTMDQGRSVVASNDIDRFNLTVNSAHSGAWPGTTNNVAYGTSLEQFIINSPVSVATGLRAVANGWSIIGNDYTQLSPTNMTLTLTNNASAFVNWATQALFSASANNGTISGAANGYYDLQTILNLTANPNANYRFSRWTGDVPSESVSNSPLSLVMDQARTITAIFSSLSPTTTYYNIVVLPCTNGTITPPGTNTVSAGGSLEFLIIGNSRYELNKAYTNGAEIAGLTGGRTNTVTWSGINADGTFSADLKRIINPAQIGVYHPGWGLWFVENTNNVNGYDSYQLGGPGFRAADMTPIFRPTFKASLC